MTQEEWNLMKKYQGIFICGFCHEKALMLDEQVEKILSTGDISCANLCKCGFHSASSYFRANIAVDFSKWRASFGSSL